MNFGQPMPPGMGYNMPAMPWAPQRPPQMGMPPQLPPGMMPPPQMPPPGPPPGMPPPATGNANLRPEDVAMFLDMQKLNPQAQAVDRQRKVAEMLRGQGAGLLKTQMVGRRPVAPGALQALGAIGTSLLGGAIDEDAAKRSQELGGKQSEASRRWFAALTGKDIPEPEPAAAAPASFFSRFLGR